MRTLLNYTKDIYNMGPYCKDTSQKSKLHGYHSLFSYNRPSISLMVSHLFTTLINVLSRTENPAADYPKVPFPSLYQSSPCFLKESYHSSKNGTRKKLELGKTKMHFFILLKLHPISCL